MRPLGSGGGGSGGDNGGLYHTPGPPCRSVGIIALYKPTYVHGYRPLLEGGNEKNKKNVLRGKQRSKTAMFHTVFFSPRTFVRFLTPRPEGGGLLIVTFLIMVMVLTNTWYANDDDGYAWWWWERL